MSDKESVFGKLRDFKYKEDAVQTNFDEFKKVVTSRRSVRVYKNESIPDQVVKDCLDLALLAPNSSNLQPWEFYWVKSEPTKSKLAQLCFAQPAATTAPTLIVCVARTQTWKINRQLMLENFKKQDNVPKAARAYYEKLVPLVYNQGPFNIYGPFKKFLFTILGFFRLVPRGPFGKSGMILWASKSTALACENLMLAFRAAGYDSCPMEGFDEWPVKKLLKLPSDAHVVMIISAGKRADGGIYGPQIRFDQKHFIKEV